MKPILEVTKISKKFTITHGQASYVSFRESIASLLKFKASESKEEFWALKDVSFDVFPGESIGIIGKNGAGKSTLLKILSRITPPTKGKIISHGRIASLLEVGTGFHPELSGRENVYFNSSILGMKRKELESKFDEIIDFSGVEKFLDLPLKHYSSGMQLRLAFAVAAFLEPEILIIDEVLAVGDAEFQKRCLGKMDEVNRSGRTLLFVSHNIGIVTQICNRAILLDKGELLQIGASREIADAYVKLQSKDQNRIRKNKADQVIWFEHIETCKADGTSVDSFFHTESMFVKIRIGYSEIMPHFNLGIVFSDRFRKRIFTINKEISPMLVIGESSCSLILEFPSGIIAPAEYSFSFALNNVQGTIVHEWIEEACVLRIIDNGSDLAFAEGQEYGCLLLDCKCDKI